MNHDDEIGIVDRRDRREIAHQFVFALRHQRFVRGLGVRHHQQRVAVGRRFGDFLRADHAAGSRAVFDHEGLAETLLQDAADLAGGNVGWPPGAEWNNHLHRSRRIVLRQRSSERCREQSPQSQCNPWAHHFSHPPDACFIHCRKLSCNVNRLSTKDWLCAPLE